MANLKSLIVSGDSSLTGLYNDGNIESVGSITGQAGFIYQDYDTSDSDGVGNYLLTGNGGAIERSKFLTSISNLLISDNNKNTVLEYTGKEPQALVFSGSLSCSLGDYLPINSTSTIPSILINGTDTKNTAGSANSTNKLFLVGTLSQTASAQSYSNTSCYMSGGYLYSGGSKCLTSVSFTAGNINYYDVDANNNRNSPEYHRAITYISVNGSSVTTRVTDCIRTLYAEYHTANTGGVVPPNYFGTSRAGFLMQNTIIQNTPAGGTIGDTGGCFKNYMLVDGYWANDVGGVTGFAMARQAPKAWIMQTTGGNKAAWNAYAELITSYNIRAYLKGGTGVTVACDISAGSTTAGQCTISASVYQLNVHGDLRSTATTPTTYQGVFKFEGIKSVATAKITSYQSSGFVSVYGMLGYSGFSGPKAYEFATGNDGFYIRNSSSSTTWNSWKKIITDKNTVDTELRGIGAIYNNSGTSNDMFVASTTDKWGISGGGKATFTSIDLSGLISSSNNGQIKKSSSDSAFTIEFDSSVRIDYSLTISGNMNCSGSAYAAAFYQSSDSRLKDIINEISLDNSYKLIDNIQEIYFKYKSDVTNTKRLGVIAQEVEEYFPEIVSIDEEGYKSVDYSKLSVICLRVIKDLKRRIEILEINK